MLAELEAGVVRNLLPMQFKLARAVAPSDAFRSIFLILCLDRLTGALPVGIIPVAQLIKAAGRRESLAAVKCDGLERTKLANPLGRVGTMEELENLATFLISGGCDWINGGRRRSPDGPDQQCRRQFHLAHGRPFTARLRRHRQYRHARHVLCDARRGSRGNVVSVVTTWVRNGGPFVVRSAMSKAAVHVMTMSLAAEWGRYGIRLNAIAPGEIPTEGMSKRLNPGERPGAYVDFGAELKKFRCHGLAKAGTAAGNQDASAA
jgi:Enoyl-(Acyl carrier protein) reductase